MNTAIKELRQAVKGKNNLNVVFNFALAIMKKLEKLGFSGSFERSNGFLIVQSSKDGSSKQVYRCAIHISSEGLMLVDFHVQHANDLQRFALERMKDQLKISLDLRFDEQLTQLLTTIEDYCILSDKVFIDLDALCRELPLMNLVLLTVHKLRIKYRGQINKRELRIWKIIPLKIKGYRFAPQYNFTDNRGNGFFSHTAGSDKY